MHFSAGSGMLMVRIVDITVNVTKDRHWRRPEFVPVEFTGDDFLLIQIVAANAVSGSVVSAVVVVVAVVVVFVGVVVTGVLIGEIVDVVTVVDFVIVLNDIVVRIRANAICTDGC